MKKKSIKITKQRVVCKSDCHVIKDQSQTQRNEQSLKLISKSDNIILRLLIINSQCTLEIADNLCINIV